MPVRIAHHVADRAETSRVANAAADIAGASSAVRIANDVGWTYDGIATIRAADRTSVAPAEGTAFRVRASLRTKVAAAKRIAPLTFRFAARVGIANHVATGPFTFGLAYAPQSAGIAPAGGVAQSIPRTNDRAARVRTSGVAGISTAEQMAFRLAGGVAQIAAAKRIARLTFEIRTSVRVAQKIAPGSGTAGVTQATGRAWVAAARGVTKHVGRAEQHIARIAAAFRTAQ